MALAVLPSWALFSRNLEILDARGDAVETLRVRVAAKQISEWPACLT